MTKVRHASLRTKFNQIASETENCLSGNETDSASVSVLYVSLRSAEPWR